LRERRPLRRKLLTPTLSSPSEERGAITSSQLQMNVTSSTQKSYVPFLL